MILIPEIETVVILVPRTGSGTLRRSIQATYPKSLLVYRHMEADGIPLGYDHWRRVGVVRHPVDRLWSLYKFLQDFGKNHDPAYAAAMRESVAMPFSDWIVNNRVPFTTPYDSAGLGRYWPLYTVRHALPENRKSQFVYLRPDLGTIHYSFAATDVLYDDLGLEPPAARENVTDDSDHPPLTAEAWDHIDRFFAWDLEAVS